MLSFSLRTVALLGFIFGSIAATFVGASAHESSLHGLVLGTLPARSEIVVRYDAFLGKPSGIATFRVVPPSASHAVRAGQTIVATADLDETPWTLRAITSNGTQSITGAARTADAPVPEILRNVHHVAIGEFAPPGDFVDQRGAPFTLRSLRGGMVVMAFVYTRCRDARECPLITSKFHTIQERLRGQPVHLVEVTLDPTYDTPAQLATYARTFGADPARWTFATGDPDRVLDFAAQFDVTAFPDERVGLIHPERLVVIDQYGTIRELIDESSWSPSEVVETIRNDQHLASNPFERLNLWLSSAAVAVCGNGVAGFSGFTDLITVIGIVGFFGFLIWRIGRGIARAT